MQTVQTGGAAAAAPPPPKVKYVRKLDDVGALSAAEKKTLAPVAEKYAFRINDYYQGLIDWDDPDDPIRRLVMPDAEELNEWGDLDASDEAANTPVRGLQHKYPDTALLLCNEVCGAYCRYCFRKRLFMNDNDDAVNDPTAGVEYIAAHPEINNVLLTGGDPLLMSTRRLADIFTRLRKIPHVRIIRLGSKMPAFDPGRILRDPGLQDALREAAQPRRPVYLMAHFDHPRELTDLAAEGLAKYAECGVTMVNQCPLIRGINDDPEVLSEMWRELSYLGCPPYYLFQGRPTAGNDPYKVPIVEGWNIFQTAMRKSSGLARRARFVMSHANGKIEILAVDGQRIHLRFHRSKDPARESEVFTAERDDSAYWLDDLKLEAA